MNGTRGIYFDERDHALLTIVDDVLARGVRDYPGFRRLLASYLHPHGIKEMAASKGLRIAYAVVHLLGSLESGAAADRISALASLRDEVLTTSRSSLRKNTARVLISIMKELVRTEDETERLMLARDFRESATGKPRVVRAQLARYHLVEMPEDWSQLAFDEHVHDANTKGRKSATHLIMDAWIKGIRKIMVIYYNHLGEGVADELLEAAAIMDIEVRVGIEFNAPFRGGFAKIVWTPKGATSAAEFRQFLAKPAVADFMRLGREASAWRRRVVDLAFEEFNEIHRPRLADSYGVDMPPLEKWAFDEFVGTGQASISHLGRFIHDRLYPLLAEKVREMAEALDLAPEEERREMRASVDEMNALDTDGIIASWLRPVRDRLLAEEAGRENLPVLMTLPACRLVEWVRSIHSPQDVTLVLTNLSVADVLEILYDCRGAVTHVEVYNMKDISLGRTRQVRETLELLQALNASSGVRLKRYIAAVLAEVRLEPGAESRERATRLTEILCDIFTLKELYRHAPLKARIGTDSTGRSCRLQGMGLVVRETLPARARRLLRRRENAIPVGVTVLRRETHVPRRMKRCGGFQDVLRERMPWLESLFTENRREHVVAGHHFCPHGGNIHPLGGVSGGCGNGFSLEKPAAPRTRRVSLRYLDSGLKNVLKISLGFVPAFLTFALTKDWWLLAYFGAVIWFAITGLRNIIQSVLGAGGFNRSELLRWKDYVSWGRIADSLLYTGFSVPLLDLLVKTMIMERLFGVTTATAPVTLYTVMALANGVYITSHNILRGLPPTAAAGNFFRSVLSIPLAVALNAGIGAVLTAAGIPNVAAVLQKWAAVISKLASDSVAGVIEGLADRALNLRMRRWDFSGKLEQIFATYERLEVLFPQRDVLAMLESPRAFLGEVEATGTELHRIVIINALDMLYFWMYQPRARNALRSALRSMTQEERRVFLLSQYVLLMEREIAQLILDGIVGRNFSRALAFYLDHHKAYLEAVQHLAVRHAPAEGVGEGAGIEEAAWEPCHVSAATSEPGGSGALGGGQQRSVEGKKTVSN